MLFENLCLLALVVMGLACGFFYRLGIKEGQGEKVSVPTFKRTVKAKIERDRYDTILDNINAYDGSAKGQKEVKG